MINVGAFAAGMAMREEKQNEQKDCINKFKATNDTAWLEKADKAQEESEQFEFFAVSQGLF